MANHYHPHHQQGYMQPTAGPPPGPGYAQGPMNPQPRPPYYHGGGYGGPSPHHPQPPAYGQPTLGPQPPQHGPAPSQPQQPVAPFLYPYQDPDGIWVYESNWGTEFLLTVALHSPWRGTEVYRESPPRTHLTYVPIANCPGTGLQRIQGYANLWQYISHNSTNTAAQAIPTANTAAPVQQDAGNGVSGSVNVKKEEEDVKVKKEKQDNIEVKKEQGVKAEKKLREYKVLSDSSDEDSSEDEQPSQRGKVNETQHKGSQATGGQQRASSVRGRHGTPHPSSSSQGAQKNGSQASGGQQERSSVRTRQSTPHPSTSSQKGDFTATVNHDEAGPSNGESSKKKKKKRSKGAAKEAKVKKSTSKHNRRYHRANKPKR